MTESTYLIEIAWEVCHKVGGIYTVIRSKVPATKEVWGDNYFLIGPAVEDQYQYEFDPTDDLSGPIGATVEHMRNMGYDVQYGTWLVTGRPKIILLKPQATFNRLETIKKGLSENFGISSAEDNELFDQILMWGDQVRTFLSVLSQKKGDTKAIAQVHEWLAGVPLLGVKEMNLPISTVFTTHATALGRSLAMNKPDFYKSLPTTDWHQEAKKYWILPIVQMERACAKNADIFTTVSELTGEECKYLLGKEPDLITPNGLNIKRFSATHEVQNLHEEFKEKIHNFVMGHFFHCYSFDLDNTLYFFTSGRFEFKNKGYDITLKALVRLNELMKKEKVDKTVVFFFITPRPSWSINPDVLHTRAVMEEINKTCEKIEEQVGRKLFYSAAADQENFTLPDLNNFVEEYWKLRYRRILQSWKTNQWPIVVTHNLKNDIDDDILKYLRDNQFVNSPLDKVKVVYHPEFINSTNPLFGIDYEDFVRGCHLGVFPSYYEPWGYTPLECIARGVPAVTSDLSGFGNYVSKNMKDYEDKGVNVLKRKTGNETKTVENLAQYLLHFTMTSRRFRMIQRNKAEDLSESFDWKELTKYYNEAYKKALE
ncbi:glycosyltransferase [Mangrovivirga sp. M17]|uniref:Glycosyltransferase n=1 Tax=Mangrovivirga halotolerans TaxID=2993936 RepID=A0ABT3RP93_9BACT|nr:glycosyltransferase [Mangrovivirga halotolerans]MCX2743630.1 glycosyltransferase [Mangrovivirga halotolerans]